MPMASPVRALSPPAAWARRSGPSASGAETLFALELGAVQRALNGYDLCLEWPQSLLLPWPVRLRNALLSWSP